MPQIVPMAQRTMRVFETFAKEGRPLTNSEMARHLGLPESSCSDLLHTLRTDGFLYRTSKSRHFYPTNRLLAVVKSIASSDPLLAIVTETLTDLTRQSGETALCGCIEGDMVKILAAQESPRALRYVLPAGTLVDLHATALGKALLGALSPDQRESLISRIPMRSATPRTLESSNDLREDIERGVRNGWFLAVDEGASGVSAIAFSGVLGDMPVSFSIVGPSGRIEQNLDRYAAIALSERERLFGRASVLQMRSA